jgi:hypothetical protein
MDMELARLQPDSPAAAEAPLRAIAWAVLCAQLAAERDLRRVLAADGRSPAAQSACGSFAPAVAAVLGASEHSVNPVALANDKALAGISAGAGGDGPADTSGARGQQ